MDYTEGQVRENNKKRKIMLRSKVSGRKGDIVRMK